MNGSTYDLKVTEEQNRFLVKVYGWMFAALLITGIVAAFFAANGLIVGLISSFGMGAVIAIIVVQLIMVIALSGWVKKMSAVVAMVVFFLYAALNGVTFSLFFLVYTPGSILNVFFITAGLFAFMSVYGFITKKDLTSMGNMLIMALLGIIVAGVINLFLKNAMMDFIITVVGVLVFIGLIAYDTQKIKNMNIIGNEGTDEDTKEAIVGALTLYLDFINLFIKLLRLLGKRK